MRNFFILTLLTILSSCNSELKSSFDTCDPDTQKMDLTAHQLVDLKFYVPNTWRVREDKRANNVNGIISMDIPLAKEEKKIRTFTVHEFDNRKTDIDDYFQSQLKLMKERNMIVLETGRKTIDNHVSYYAVTRDTIDGNPINQLFLFTDYFEKRYTIQLAITASNTPTAELCKSMWLVDKIELMRD